MSLSVAVCQFTAGLDVEANTRTCLDLIDQADAAGARLVVLPEASMYFDPHKTQTDGSHGQPVEGPFVEAVAEAAKSHGLTVVVGMSEAVEGEPRDFNTAVVVSDVGEVASVYRKVHLYDAFGYQESSTVRPGEVVAPTLVDVDGVRVAVLTCYDLRFPEIFRWVVDAGADLVVLPAAWAVGPAKEDHWRTLIKARAIENTVFLAAAGQTAPVSCGQSMVVDPMGVELACAGLEPGIAVATVDRNRVTAVRSTNPSLENRRFVVQPK